MTIQLLVSDLDGTLLKRSADDHHEIAELDRRALDEACSAGIVVCLASGRLYPDIFTIASSLDLACHAISQNGAAIYLHTGESLHSSSFDIELAVSLLHFAPTHRFARSVSCTDETVYVPAEHTDLAQVRKRISAPMPLHDQLAAAFGTTLSPTKFCYYGELAALQELQAQIQDTFKDHVDALLTDVDCLDIMPAGTSKGAALRRLLSHMGLRADEVACVGDQYNDISMFHVTPHSFAMATAPREVQAQAAYVVPSVSEVVRFALAHNGA